MRKRFVTHEEAVALLPDGEYVHTIVNNGCAMVGADWSREDILKELHSKEVIELTGEHARSMGHGICAYNKDAKWQIDLLFIETDTEKLKAFDAEVEV